MQTQELLALHGMEHPTLEEMAWRASEPHTPHPRKRIEAVAGLTGLAFRRACARHTGAGTSKRCSISSLASVLSETSPEPPCSIRADLAPVGRPAASYTGAPCTSGST